MQKHVKIAFTMAQYAIMLMGETHNKKEGQTSSNHYSNIRDYPSGDRRVFAFWPKA